MAVSFRKVNPVESGAPITSTQLAQLAGAVNDRLASGLGDPTWRIVWWFDSMTRQIRNPDDSGQLFPARSEFLETYAHVKPADYTWPIAPPGEAEGANLASILPAFVFGSAGDDLEPEDERIVDGLTLWRGIFAPESIRDKWELAKRQRGFYDPITGAFAAPAFDVARAHYRIVRSTRGTQGMAYGGFIPTPEYLGDCGDGSSELPATPNYQIFFTSLTGQPTRTYAGTCPATDGHVQFLIATPFAYLVGVYQSGTTVLDVLSAQEWIEGSYSGGNRLAHTPGDHLARVANYFAGTFRGTQDQLAKNEWNGYSFDTHEFLSRQYLLAPARGAVVGNAVSGDYPAFELYGALKFTPGTRMRVVGSGAMTMQAQPGFVYASIGVFAQGLAGATTIEILAGSAVIGSVTLTANATNEASDIKVFDTPIPEGVDVSIRLATGMQLIDSTSASGIRVEFSELLKYRPQGHDLVLLLRAAGARIDLYNGHDGFGIDEDQSRKIGENYFRYGTVLNVRGDPGPAGSFAEINTNAIMEAARRMSQWVKLLKRQHLIGYEVQGGKSILYFRRETGFGGSNAAPPTPVASTEVASGDLIPGTLYIVGASGGDDVIYNGVNYANEETFKAIAGVTTYTASGTAKVYTAYRGIADPGSSGDAFLGLGPSTDPIVSGTIEQARAYLVRSTGGARVAYAGKWYADGESFMGTDDPNFNPDAGAKVYERDGIRQKAPTGGFSNRWLFGVQLKVYRNNIESIWKPDAYSDYFSFSNRCHFYPNPLTPTLDAQARVQFAAGSRYWLAPESPSGYNYVRSLNDIICGDSTCEEQRRSFYKSCRIYEPDIEIESAETVFEDGQMVLKVTLKSRLHHCSSAPGSIARDVAGWDATALRNEEYRTLENGLREYLVRQYLGINCKGGGTNGGDQVGNSAWNSPVWGFPDNPFGACFPSFLFTKMIPTPYEDDNDTQQITDSPLWHDVFPQIETYLRCICEGCVDGATSEQYGCETGISALYDYTFENLCFDAFKGRWFSTLPTVKTRYFQENDIREDKPKGHGPLPNTFASSEIFNQFAAAVNKLNKYRVALPYLFEAQDLTGFASTTVDANDPDGNLKPCVSSPTAPGFVWSGVPPGAGAGSPGPWVETTGAASGTVSAFKTLSTSPPTYDCVGSAFQIYTSRTDQNFRFKLANPDALHAIPDSWADMINTDGGFLGLQTANKMEQGVQPVAFGASADCHGAQGHWNRSAGDYFAFPFTNPEVQHECRIFSNSGNVSAPALGSVVIAGGWITGVTNGACVEGATTTASITPLPSDGILFQVPLT